MNQLNKNANQSNLASSHRQYGKSKFEDKYRRMTIYLEQDLFNQIQYQREQGLIMNLTEFVNKAITSYLIRT